MPRRGWQLVLLNHANFPIAILHLLLQQSSQRFTRIVPTLDFGRLPDFSALTRKPEVKFVVLIPNQFLVKHANAIEYLAGPAAEVNCVDWTRIIGIVPARATTSKSGLESGRDRLANFSPAPSNPRTANIVRTRFFQHFHASSHVVRGIICVRIHAYDN